MDNAINKQLLNKDRNTTSISLFFVWLAATTSVSSIPIAALIINSFNSVPLVLIYIFGFASYIMLGIISLPGFWYGIPMMVYSGFVFKKINLLLSIINWISQTGWQVIILIMITYLLENLVFSTADLKNALISLLASIILCYIAPILGIKYMSFIQYISSIVLVIASIYVVFFISPSLSEFTGLKNTSFSLLKLFSAFSLMLTCSVFSWTMFASDYSRHLKAKYSSIQSVTSSFIGGGVGSTIALIAGSILYINHFIVFHSNSITLNSSTLPWWFNKLFLLLSILGLAAANYMNIYSASINIGVITKSNKPRILFSFVNLIFVFCIALIYIIFIRSFLEALEQFLGLMVIFVAPWTGYIIVIIIENIRNRKELQEYLKDSYANSMLLGLDIVITLCYYLCFSFGNDTKDQYILWTTALVGLVIGIVTSLIMFMLNRSSVVYKLKRIGDY